MASARKEESSARRVNEFSFVDLFSGIGGFRLALENLGGQCMYSCEKDRFSRKIYEANFEPVTFHDIRDMCPLKGYANHAPPDFLAAGFPCQPFSTAGRRYGFEPSPFDVARNGNLFEVLADLIQMSRPKMFLLENVKGLLSIQDGQAIKQVVWTLEEKLGYWTYRKVVDASSWVPQRRQRVFIAGFDKLRGFDFEKLDVPEQKPKLKTILEPSVAPKYTISDAAWSCHLRHKFNQRNKGNGFGFGLCTGEGQARTLLSRYYKDGSEILIQQASGNPRMLTERECARLMGFPDTFELPVSRTQAYKKLGNSVVVPVVESIAKLMLTATPWISDERH